MTDNLNLEEKIKSKVLELGADFIGIAPHSRFENAPDWSRPENLLPDYGSVISYGITMNRGALKTWFNKKTRRPLTLYHMRCLNQLEQIAMQLSHWLERQGFESTFIAPNGYYNMYRLKPDFSHKHAAVAAGLGKLGHSSNFVHPEFGAAVWLCSVITEADLAPDPMIAADFDPCDGCNICLDICPTKAIAGSKTQSFVMEGREHCHKYVNKGHCIWGCAGYTGHQYKINGRTVGTWSYNNLPVPTKELKAAEERGESSFVGILDSFKNTGYRQPRHPMEVAEGLLSQDHVLNIDIDYCGYCQKVCAGTLEERRALMELHINSGVVQIPEDPTLLNYLKEYNGGLQPHPIPESLMGPASAYEEDKR